MCKKSSPEQLDEVISALAVDGPHRAAASRLGDAIRARSGTASGADALESLVIDRAENGIAR